jgi:hypothetical protein
MSLNFSSLKDFKPINLICLPTPQLFEHESPHYIDNCFKKFYYLFTIDIVLETQLCLFSNDRIKTQSKVDDLVKF